MNGLQSLRLGLRSLLRRDRVERELDDELRFHLEMETALHVQRGLSPAAARREALRTFGGVEKTKEQCRELRPMSWLEDLGRDLRYGARALLRSPGFSAVVVLTLALGIGANTAIFSVVYGVLLRPLAFEQGERLLRLRQQAPRAGVEDLGISPLEIADYARSRSLSGVAEHHSMWFNLLDRGEPERVKTGVVSAHYFRVLGVRPLLGRAFTPEDEKPGAEPVLILSHQYWRESHGGDPEIIGRKFEMNDKVHTVVGVLPPMSLYTDDSIFMPTSACPFRSVPESRRDRDFRMVTAFARLGPDASLEQARTEVATIARQMAAAHPETYPADQGHAATLTPLQEEMTGEARPTLLILLGTVGLVLLIVCANVANLTLARQLGRERELAVRGALGAGRGRLVRQLLTESTLLAVAGGALGLLFAVGGLRLLMTFAARFIPRANEIAIDGPVLLFTVAVSLLTGLAAGSLPALLEHDLSAVLKEGDRSSSGTRGLRFRNLLVVGQLALSFVLLICAGLMLRSLWAVHQVDPGFRPESVLTANLDLDWAKYDTPVKRREVYDRLLARAATLPGVGTAALASTFPLDQATASIQQFLRIEGRTIPEGQPLPQIELRVASPDYFHTLGIPLLRGRVFTEQDGPDAPGVAIVNRTTARRFWGDGDPIGERISFDGGESWHTIVGVVGDVRQYGLDREAIDEVYRPLRQFPLLRARLVLGSGVPAATLEKSVRAVVREIDPEQPVYGIQTLEQSRAASLAPSRLVALLLGIFAGLALIVTATGIGGLLAFSIGQRTHEIGIRMALGAARSSVLWMVLRQGAILVGIGLGLGLLGALALTRVMSTLLYGVEPTDPLTFIGVSLVLLAVAALACWMPARKATGVHPILALRKV